MNGVKYLVSNEIFYFKLKYVQVGGLFNFKGQKVKSFIPAKLGFFNIISVYIFNKLVDGCS